MALNNILRNFAVYVDGFGKFGDGSECKLPPLKFKTEEYLGGGMYTAVKIDQSMEALEAEFKLTSFDPQVISVVGLAPGLEKNFTFRGALIGTDGTTNAAIAYMLARIVEWDPNMWKVGTKIETNFKLNVYRYKLTVGGQNLIEVDPYNCIYKVNGVDQQAFVQQALGF
jgi:P2 family phage contractile tail tube protein